MKLINRQAYLHKITSLIGRNLIICITGQRRVGKSCLMRTLVSTWSAHHDANIIYIDKEKNDFDGIRNYTDLNAYIDCHSTAGHNYILIDEVQLIDGFERSLCNYYDQDGYDVVVTGSNAKMLSGINFPAVLIGRLGVSSEFRGKGLNIGSQILDFVKDWFRSEDNKTGCRFIVVDAYNNEQTLHFYEKNGFKPLYKTEEEEREFLRLKNDEPLETRFMFFDLKLK